MRRHASLTSMIIVAACLSGCATLFSQKLDYDPKAVRVPAAITVSDPKVYSRQGLISERQKDVAWIDKLIDDSRSQNFEPELLREVEQISAFAAALGLKFDPAAGLNYRRDEETGDIQQEIDALKMQFQLEQLRRDLELLRAKWPDQTDPVNNDLGKLPAGTTPDATSTVSASAADQLKQAIERLLQASEGRLDADGKAPRQSTAHVSPIDLFRDRSAYRDLLKSARNAAELDEAHDLQGAVLIRLNFQATAVPDPKYPRSLGVVQIKPKPPTSGPGSKFLIQWANDLNADLESQKSKAKIDILSDLKMVGRFDLSTGLAWYCGGPWDRVKAFPLCQKRVVVIPLLLDAADGNPLDLKSIYAETLSFWSVPKKNAESRSFDAPSGDGSLFPGETVATDDGEFILYRKLRASTNYLSSKNLGQEKRNAICEVLTSKDGQDAQGDLILSDLNYAKLIIENQDVVRIGSGLMRSLGIRNDEWENIESRVADAKDFIEFSAGRLPECANSVRNYSVSPKRIVWAVTRAGGIANAVRVYEVGPREQVQQVSTVARAANSLALAANLAASAPGSGAAAEAAANYSRQATGRADARERVPSVVGYANGSENASPVFGWVIGPQATIDPKGAIHMAQPFKTYDLAVDLSIPGYVDVLELEVKSQWGPSPADIVVSMEEGVEESNTSAATGGMKPEKATARRKTWATRTIRVPVPFVANDFDVFTRSLLGDHAMPLEEPVVEGGPVSTCRESVLVVSGGVGLWRAKSVLVGNALIKKEDISILPSMRGISFAVPKMSDQTGPYVNVLILTPQGNFPASVSNVEKPVDGCEQEKSPAAATPSDGPVVTGIEPSNGTFKVPAPILMQLIGTKLNDVDRVTLRAAEGKITKRATDGTWLMVTFDESDTKGFWPQRDDKVILYVKDKKKADRAVWLIRQNGD